MKRSYKFTTRRQYQQIAVELEAEQELTDEMVLDVVAEFEQAQRIIDGGDGITDKEFRAIVDAMMKNESIKNGSEIWPLMSVEQQGICQAIKKSIKRINNKTNKEE